MSVEVQREPCPICGGRLIRVKLFVREWVECPNSVLEFFNGMATDGSKPFYDGPTHDQPEAPALVGRIPDPGPPKG